MAEMIRLQFDLAAQQVEILDTLMKEGAIRTRKELFNTAFSLLEWAIRQRKSGRTIASISGLDQSYRELSMPFLDRVQPDPALVARSGFGGAPAQPLVAAKR